MSQEIITVVGGEGRFGSRVARGLSDLGHSVLVCEKGDRLATFLPQSQAIFFAIDADQIADMLQANKRNIRPEQMILDGASVKAPLISPYHELDKEGVSICSTHLGAIPTHPWRGVKVWLCSVGANSTEAQRLALNLYIARNTVIEVIDIEEHQKVEQDQWVTFAVMHLLASTLRQANLPLEDFNRFATLNSELLTLPLGRTLGQGPLVPSEILFSQPRKDEFVDGIKEALQEFADALTSKEKVQALMKENIAFHDDEKNGRRGVVERVFRKAGIVGARNANLRMYSLSFRIVDDEPGKLIKLLGPFYNEGVNLTAIDSMPGITTQEEIKVGVDPDKVVDFDIGVDPNTMTEVQEKRIKEGLRALGCRINYSGFRLA